MFFKLSFIILGVFILSVITLIVVMLIVLSVMAPFHPALCTVLCDQLKRDLSKNEYYFFWLHDIQYDDTQQRDTQHINKNVTLSISEHDYFADRSLC